jgi:capsid protein
MFLRIALASGALKLPENIDIASLEDALYTPPQMPWIDPLKEATAWALLEENRYASGPEIIRRRGKNPIDVLDQEQRWQEQLRERELVVNAPLPEITMTDEPENPDEDGDQANGQTMVSITRRR